MPDANPKPPARRSAGVKLLLFFAAVAVVGLIVPWCVGDVLDEQGTAWRQSLGVLLAVVAMLSVLLVWIVRTRAPVHAFSLVFGVLAGVCLVVDAAFALALFDYEASRDLAVALRIVRLVPMLAAVAAVVGCLLGFGGAMVWAFFHRGARSTHAPATDADAPPPGRRWLPRLVVCSLVAALGVALYGPLAHELTRRRAVLAIRAAGGQVSSDGRRRVGIPPNWGQAGELLAFLIAPERTYGQGESWLYSLEVIYAVSLAKDAGDDQLAYVCDLPEVADLNLSDTKVTAAGLERVSSELKLAHLHLQRMPVTAEGLRHLAGMPSLSYLDLSEAPITDDSLTELAGAASLRYLSLTRTPITDEGLGHLAGLGLLMQLDLRGTRITNNGLQHVGQMASLRSLYLGDTPISSAGLKHLIPIQGLMWLDLSKTELTERGLGQLAGLPALSHLVLEGAHLDEAAVQELSKLGRLKVLNLNGTNVTDESLRHLSGMKAPSLYVALYATDISDEALRLLQQSLPKAEGGRRPGVGGLPLPARAARPGSQ